jgi:hypothetical protein
VFRPKPRRRRAPAAIRIGKRSNRIQAAPNEPTIEPDSRRNIHSRRSVEHDASLEVNIASRKTAFAQAFAVFFLWCAHQPTFAATVGTLAGAAIRYIDGRGHRLPRRHRSRCVDSNARAAACGRCNARLLPTHLPP